jgi:NitT/TauT family transport system ATP-binding protein
MDGEPAFIRLAGVGLQHPGARQPALAGIDLAIEPGEFLSVLGPSGCGKSTLLRLIAGLLAPTLGSVEVPRDPAHPPAMVFQGPTLLPWSNVLANVALPLRLAGVAAGAARERALAMLARVGLANAATLMPHALSGGMQMRVSIARALVTGPSLLLMDEPFAALDEILRLQMDLELLALWQERGMSVVFVTHSIQEAVFLSQRVVTLGGAPAGVTSSLAITAPFPRSAQFLHSPEFAQLARHLQATLLGASVQATTRSPA